MAFTQISAKGVKINKQTLQITFENSSETVIGEFAIAEAAALVLLTAGYNPLRPHCPKGLPIADKSKYIELRSRLSSLLDEVLIEMETNGFTVNSIEKNWKIK